MINAGDTITNPVTGERMTFLKTSAETGGEYVLIELEAEPGAVVAAAHVHPAQTETFGGGRGDAGREGGRQEARGAARRHPDRRGQASRTGGGTPARTGSLPLRGAARARVRVADRDHVQPGGRRQDEPGRPSDPLRLAVIAQHHLEDVVLPGIPVWLQRSALTAGAPLGRLLGYARRCTRPRAPRSPRPRPRPSDHREVRHNGHHRNPARALPRGQRRPRGRGRLGRGSARVQPHRGAAARSSWRCPPTRRTSRSSSEFARCTTA